MTTPGPKPPQESMRQQGAGRGFRDGRPFQRYRVQLSRMSRRTMMMTTEKASTTSARRSAHQTSFLWALV